jgi:integrase
MNPLVFESLSSLGGSKDLRKAIFEQQVPGAVYAGATLRNLQRKRNPSDGIFIQMPVGKRLEELIASILADATGECKTISLLAHEAGLVFGVGKRLEWDFVTESSISWVSAGSRIEVDTTELLGKHLRSLPRSGKFINPTLALMPQQWLNCEFRKACRALSPAFRRILRRFSISRILVGRYHELASKGQRPQHRLVASRPDLKFRVKARLNAILADSSTNLPRKAALRPSLYRALDIAEIRMLVHRLDGEWKLGVSILFYVFVSVAELCRLAWEDFDLDRGIVTLPCGRSEPIASPLLKFLRNWPGKKDGKIVRHTSDTGMISAAIPVFRDAGLNDFSVRLTSVRKAALELLCRLGVIVTERRKVLLAAGYGGKRPTQAARDILLQKAISKFPNVFSMPTECSSRRPLSQDPQQLGNGKS